MPATEKIHDTAAEIAGAGSKAGVSMGEFESALGFVLRIAQLTAFERFFDALGDCGIKVSEFTVLLAIAENPGVRQGMIADVLKIKWPNMTKLVRSLEERELIGRHIPPHDRRSVELHVTEAGRRMIREVGAQMYESDKKAFAMLTDDEQGQLLKLARKVAGWPPLPEGHAK